jgi:hypothetical protein
MMAKGLRIHHPTERNVILLVPLPAKRPELGGVPKDMHIHLDENGDSIVSSGVWDDLLLSKESGLSMHEFVILNEVPDPPTILSGPGVRGAQVKRTVKETQPGTLYDTELQAIAQQFAPKGVKARITTNKKEEE